jgi:hypothetical protein
MEAKNPTRSEQYEMLSRALQSMISRLAAGQIEDLKEAELLIRSTEVYITLCDLEAEVLSRRNKLRNRGEAGP